ncbi:hypothetical protein PENSPDRAFT_571773 [Peniophora sp. CONT]|nr:hypothetical protein PENSPDRAFT_571773 [Peniophora sp. CONT]
MPKQQSRSAAAFRAYRGHTQVAQRAIATGRGTSYDAEMFALTMAIGAVTKLDNVDHIHIFTDCKSAVLTILDTNIHPAQALAVTACRHLRKWLETHDGTITLHWCPGHAGFAFNEIVDVDARRAAATLRKSPYQSHSFRLSGTRLAALTDWRILARSPAYRGHQFLLGRGPIKISDRLKTQGTMLHHAGDSSSLMARLTRSTLNHAPTGEFRIRFFPNEPINCDACGDGRYGLLHSRFHILNECGRYVRPPDFYNTLKRSPNPGASLTEFLINNPTAFSFDDAPSAI